MDEVGRIKNEGSQRFENGESGAANKGFFNSGKREFHNIGEHHSKKTTITKSESSESHNIGGSEEFNNGAASSGSFKKHHNGARHYGHEHERGAHASAST
ncbi:unnamed protein product [Pieris macdunnoughi]|uniref:Uncharacterized protein n=1 Tax=Pieris macdunnoughi TaxID=345717 RepID=A0A821V5C2_9NEOP|nr:unnamed protein product [Pieris macdunnoughi]